MFIATRHLASHVRVAMCSGPLSSHANNYLQIIWIGFVPRWTKVTRSRRSTKAKQRWNWFIDHVWWVPEPLRYSWKERFQVRRKWLSSRVARHNKDHTDFLCAHCLLREATYMPIPVFLCTVMSQKMQDVFAKSHFILSWGCCSHLKWNSV